MTVKLLPTSAPKPIPPEFMEKFVKHGWRRVENIWGKSTVLAWSKAIGRKRMAAQRKAYLAQEAAQGVKGGKVVSGMPKGAIRSVDGVSRRFTGDF